MISLVGVSVDELRRGGNEETSCAVALSSFVAGFLVGSSIAGGFSRCTCRSAECNVRFRTRNTVSLDSNSPRV